MKSDFLILMLHNLQMISTQTKIMVVLRRTWVLPHVCRSPIPDTNITLSGTFELDFALILRTIKATLKSGCKNKAGCYNPEIVDEELFYSVLDFGL